MAGFITICVLTTIGSIVYSYRLCERFNWLEDKIIKQGRTIDREKSDYENCRKEKDNYRDIINLKKGEIKQLRELIEDERLKTKRLIEEINDQHAEHINKLKNYYESE